jgi:hypothetical protein
VREIAEEKSETGPEISGPIAERREIRWEIAEGKVETAAEITGQIVESSAKCPRSADTATHGRHYP